MFNHANNRSISYLDWFITPYSDFLIWFDNSGICHIFDWSSTAHFDVNTLFGQETFPFFFCNQCEFRRSLPEYKIKKSTYIVKFYSKDKFIKFYWRLFTAYMCVRYDRNRFLNHTQQILN